MMPWEIILPSGEEMTLRYIKYGVLEIKTINNSQSYYLFYYEYDIERNDNFSKIQYRISLSTDYLENNRNVTFGFSDEVKGKLEEIIRQAKEIDKENKKEVIHKEETLEFSAEINNIKLDIISRLSIFERYSLVKLQSGNIGLKTTYYTSIGGHETIEGDEVIAVPVDKITLIKQAIKSNNIDLIKEEIDNITDNFKSSFWLVREVCQ